MKTITQNHDFISWEEFLLQVEKASNQNLTWFYNQWFNQRGAPDWDIHWFQSQDSLRIEILQKPPYYRIDNLEVDIISNDLKILQKSFPINGNKTIQSIPVSFQVKEVKVDPYFKILHWDKQYKEEASALLPAILIQKERFNGHLDKADSVYKEAIKRVPSIDKYGLTFNLEYEIARVKTMKGDSAGAMKHYLNAIQQPVRGELLPLVYFRLAELAKGAKDQILFEQASIMAIAADAIVGNAYGIQEQIQSLKN